MNYNEPRFRYEHFKVSNPKLAETSVKLFNDILANIWMYLTKPMIDIATEFIRVSTLFTYSLAINCCQLKMFKHRKLVFIMVRMEFLVLNMFNFRFCSKISKCRLH